MCLSIGMGLCMGVWLSKMNNLSTKRDTEIKSGWRWDMVIRGSDVGFTWTQQSVTFPQTVLLGVPSPT